MQIPGLGAQWGRKTPLVPASDPKCYWAAVRQAEPKAPLWSLKDQGSFGLPQLAPSCRKPGSTEWVGALGRDGLGFWVCSWLAEMEESRKRRRKKPPN